MNNDLNSKTSFEKYCKKYGEKCSWFFNKYICCCCVLVKYNKKEITLNILKSFSKYFKSFTIIVDV